MKGRFKARQPASHSPASTFIPDFRSLSTPLPLTRGFGSIIPIKTLEMPAAATASAQGGVLPKWEQGSSVTYRSAPLARPPASLRAWTSACGVPAFRCQPSPTVSPFLTITQPTAGLGDVLPTPLRASCIARFMIFSSNPLTGAGLYPEQFPLFSGLPSVPPSAGPEAPT